jgi:hypothetical protein
MGDDLVEYYQDLCRKPHVTRVEIVHSPDQLKIEVLHPRQPPFFHVKVEDAFRAVRLPLDACLALGSWEESTPYGDYFIPYAIIKVALLGCEPFIDPGPPQIQYVPKSEKGEQPSPRLFTCRDWDALWGGLADAWCTYEEGRTDVQAARREAADIPVKLVAAQRDFIPVLKALDKRKQGFAHSDDSPAAVRRNGQSVAWAAFMSTEDEQRHGVEEGSQGWASQVLDLKRQLVVSMSDAFADDGPQPFPYAAVHAALAAILNRLGVRNRDGNDFTAAGIKSLLGSRPTGFRRRR